MSSSNERMLRSERLIRQLTDVEQLIKEIEENRGAILIPEESPFDSHQSLESTDGRIETLENISGKKFNYLTGTEKFEDTTILNGNIENYIGMTMIPTGVIGPVKVLGTAAKGDFYVPMATSEGALVASYQRGSKATRMSGGITSVCLVEVVQRSPVFKFTDLSDLGKVLIWVIQLKPVFEKITLENSRYADLQDMKANVEGNHLILSFEFYCGDASGQNMVTLCADAICKYILENTPVKPNTWYIESNYSGDKKATASSFVNTRGRKVTSECLLPKAVVAKVLRTTPEKMQEYWIT
ncbi:MAG: 3-hydroxy-3-methylglutaryl-CoA reductase, partial [Bacteroidetes bacterium]|nr:3-hydroxy-3-methylglutaryl-CoA reductase [Bacteroidota bacterium]